MQLNTQPNAQYNLAAPNSLAVKVATRMRKRMFRQFLDLTRIAPEQTIVDVGVTSDQSYESSNYFEAWYPYKDKVTAVGLDDAAYLEKKYPGMKFVKADGRDLPFSDNEFDYSHSSAVIEHVGDAESQLRFLHELYRVTRYGIFVTTPNRWFPIEFHTQLPLLHWLPKPVFRSLMKGIGMEFFSLECNLNLLGKTDIRHMCKMLGVPNAQISALRLGGWTSNLVLYISK